MTVVYIQKYLDKILQNSVHILINLVTNYSISQQLLWITIQGNIKLNLGSQTHRIINHLETMCWIKAHNSHCLPKWELLFIHTWVSPSLTTHQFSSVAQSCPTLQPHGLQHTRPPRPSITPRAYSNSCPLSQWCYPTISSSLVPYASDLQSFPASGSFPMSHFFASGGQTMGISASASVLPIIIQDWFPLG